MTAPRQDTSTSLDEFDPDTTQPNWTFSRRQWLRGAATGAAALALPYQVLAETGRRPVTQAFSPDYGPLSPVADDATGLPLLQLPEGFRYISYGWTGDLMDDGRPTPGLHDGMAVCASGLRRLVLGRNHEQGGATGSFADPSATFDARADGGTTRVVFDFRQGKFLSSNAMLSGTIRNCAGGPTPWGSWLTCEETSVGPHTQVNGEFPFLQQHGWVFDVPSLGTVRPTPLEALGAFSHEACAVDPATGIVYETEDATPSGFYRFVPTTPGRLARGGKLQMMKLDAAPNASIVIEGETLSYFNTGAPGLANGTTWNVSWVDIDEPERMFTSGTSYGGVRQQGLRQGASSLVRGEGCWYGNGVVYVCSTSGGSAGNGQIFAYDPRRETFTLLYESVGDEAVDNPDNIAWSPRGSLILCEDGNTSPQRLRGLTLDGTIFPFCANNLDFTSAGMGSYTRPSGSVFNADYRGAECCGATFQGQWLFFNIQTPGITFAVTGPWNNGAL